MSDFETDTVKPISPSERALLGISLEPYANVRAFNIPKAVQGGYVRDRIYAAEGITPYNLQVSELRIAAEPYIAIEERIAEYADQIRVDIDAATELLVEYGQSEEDARSIRVAFVDAERLAKKARIPSNVQIAGWSEPGIVWKRESEDRGPLGYLNFIGLPIEGPNDVTEDGIASLNVRFIHELGHCALRPLPHVLSLYEPGENGKTLPYWNKRVFGVIPVALAVSYLKTRGHSEYSALWQLDPQERLARAFASRHSNVKILSLAR